MIRKTLKGFRIAATILCGAVLAMLGAFVVTTAAPVYSFADLQPIDVIGAALLFVGAGNCVVSLVTFP